MALKALNIACPNCGANVSTDQKVCEFCKQPVIIRDIKTVSPMELTIIKKYAGSYKKSLEENPDNPELNNSIGICFLQLKLYDKALVAFEKAIDENMDNPDTYFYAAIALLNGKKAFLADKNTISKIEEYLEAAKLLEQKGIYSYFHAYIKYDYYKRKFYKTSPSYEELLKEAETLGCTEEEAINLFMLLNVERPEVLK